MNAIPANPGWVMRLRWSREGHPDTTDELPVVAWVIDSENGIVTAVGMRPSGTPTFLVDGVSVDDEWPPSSVEIVNLG